MPVDQEKLAKLAASVRTGGKGSVARRRLFTRRQQQACSNPLSTNFVVFNDDHTDDKRLQNTLKRLGVNNIPGIEEVNEIMDSSLSPPR